MFSVLQFSGKTERLQQAAGKKASWLLHSFNHNSEMRHDEKEGMVAYTFLASQPETQFHGLPDFSLKEII